jgi:O-antigen/teichoic acid export membrane protein
MFLGMVRPIFNSRFTHPDDFPKLMEMANALFRLNLLVLLVPFIVFAVAGEPIFDWLTAGKYAEAAAIFLAFFGVLILGSANPMIDVLVKVVEQNRIYTVTNLVLSASIVLAVPLIPHIGLWALAVANGAGTVLAIVIIVAYLRRRGYLMTIDWKLIWRIAASAAAAVATGHLLLRAGVPTLLAVVLSHAVFALLLYLRPPFRPGEIAHLRSVTRRTKRRDMSKMSTSTTLGGGHKSYGKE